MEVKKKKKITIVILRKIIKMSVVKNMNIIMNTRLIVAADMNIIMSMMTAAVAVTTIITSMKTIAVAVTIITNMAVAAVAVANMERKMKKFLL